MLIGTRLFCTLIVSLGLANCVAASPIAVNLVHANSENNISEKMLAAQAELDSSLVGSPNNVQSDHFNVENVKQKPGKIFKVAEPSSLMLLGLGLLGLGFLRRRKH